MHNFPPYASVEWREWLNLYYPPGHGVLHSVIGKPYTQEGVKISSWHLIRLTFKMPIQTKQDGCAGNQGHDGTRHEVDKATQVKEQEVTQIGKTSCECSQEDGIFVSFPDKRCTYKRNKSYPKQIEPVLPDDRSGSFGVVHFQSFWIHRIGNPRYRSADVIG